MTDATSLKPLAWVAGSKRDLQAMPAEVQDVFGYALHLAQVGSKHAQYTVKFAAAVYVRHCFQKKSAKGIATPKPDLDLIAARLKAAEAHARGATP